MSDTARIHTKLTADGSELTRALGKGISQAGSFQSQMKGLGTSIGAAFSVAAIGSFIRSTTAAADEIADVASSLGLSTDELQSFDAAARMTAGGVDGMRMAVKKMIEVQAQAQDGDAAATAKIARLGLGTRGLTASTGELVKAAADHYKSTGDLAGIYDLFGRQAVNVRDVFDDIAGKSLPDFIAAQKEAGQVVESSIIGTLEHTNDLLDRYGKKLQNWKMAFVGGVVRGVEQIGAMMDGDARPLEEINKAPEKLNALERELAARRELTAEQKVAIRAQEEMVRLMNEAGRAAELQKEKQAKDFAEILKSYEVGMAANQGLADDGSKNPFVASIERIGGGNFGNNAFQKPPEDPSAKVVAAIKEELPILKGILEAAKKFTGGTF